MSIQIQSDVVLSSPVATDAYEATLPSGFLSSLVAERSARELIIRLGTSVVFYPDSYFPAGTGVTARVYHAPRYPEVMVVEIHPRDADRVRKILNRMRDVPSAPEAVEILPGVLAMQHATGTLADISAASTRDRLLMVLAAARLCAELDAAGLVYKDVTPAGFVTSAHGGQWQTHSWPTHVDFRNVASVFEDASENAKKHMALDFLTLFFKFVMESDIDTAPLHMHHIWKHAPPIRAEDFDTIAKVVDLLRILESDPDARIETRSEEPHTFQRKRTLTDRVNSAVAYQGRKLLDKYDMFKTDREAARMTRSELAVDSDRSPSPPPRLRMNL